MFKLLKFIVWTGLAIGLGVFIAKYEIDGRTPLEHAQHLWKRKVNPSKVDQLKDGLHDVLGAASKKPERYSPDERNAIDQIIAKRQAK